MWRVRIAGCGRVLPLSVSQSFTAECTQTRRQKGKGRVCLGGEEHSKEEEKGKEEIRGWANSSIRPAAGRRS